MLRRVRKRLCAKNKEETAQYAQLSTKGMKEAKENPRKGCQEM